jgi:hypothetical protein
MIQALSVSPTPPAGWLARIDRLSTARLLAVLTVLEVLLLAAENTLDYPLSVPFMVRTTGRPFLDMCAFCSSTEVLNQVNDFGPVGRHLQLLLMPTIDVLIPVLSCAFGVVALSVLLRGRKEAWMRRLRLLPFLAMGLDFSENLGIIAVVSRYPNRLESVAALTGILSGLKFCAYLLTVAAIVGLTAVRVAAPRLAALRPT